MSSEVMLPAGRLQVATPKTMAESIDTPTEARDAVDRRVQPVVQEALAAEAGLGGTITGLVATKAGAAVNTALDGSDVLRGRASAVIPGRTWGHSTPPDASGRSYPLPLGYDEKGHLDQLARNIMGDDILGRVRYPEDGINAFVITARTPDGVDHVLVRQQLNGDTVIPGLTSSASSSYADIPYIPGQRMLPTTSEKRKLAIWGSSTMEGIASTLRAKVQAVGGSMYDGGKGAERIEDTAARMNARPAVITFASGVLASGGMNVTNSSGLNPVMKPYDGALENGVRGRLAFDGSQLRFIRAASGEAIPGPLTLEFHADEGIAHRNDTIMLQVAKNNMGLGPIRDPLYCFQITKQMYDYQAARDKRVLVVGQFANTGDSAANKALYAQYDSLCRDHFGATFWDTSAWLRSEQVWSDCGVTPSATDLAQQAAGEKPAILSQDPGHFNAAGYNGYADRLLGYMRNDLGWMA